MFNWTKNLQAQLEAANKKISELEQGKCLHQIAEPAEQSATYGMHFGARVLHIGGRENAAGYIEFGSVEAVRVLVGQVLRDLPVGAPGFELAATRPTQQGLDADTQRQLDIGKAVERACKELPEVAGITISLERGAGMVEMIDWDGNEFDHFDQDHEDFAARINAATDAAIAAEQLAAQAKQGGV